MMLVGYDDVESKVMSLKLLIQKCCRSSKLSENQLKVRPPLPIQSPGPQQWESWTGRFCLFSSICLVWIELDSMSSGGLVRFP